MMLPLSKFPISWLHPPRLPAPSTSIRFSRFEVAATAGALASMHGQYVRLTARSMALAKQHGLLQSGDGGWRRLVVSCLFGVVEPVVEAVLG